MVFTSTLARAGGDFDGRGPAARGYGRLFGNLPEWKHDGADPVAHLWEMSEAMYVDDGDDNGAIPAGYTYFGQLINHDLTFDAGSSLEERTLPAALRNLRTPRFDLDCVYGRGPRDQSYLYDGDKGAFVLGRNVAGELDLLRSPVTLGGSSRHSENPFNLRRPAIIGDSRNDENIIIAQLHLAVQRFHNRRIRAGDGFDAARRATRWHYQWVAIHDYLKRLCGAPLVDAVLGRDGRPDLRGFDPRLHPYIPIEFSAAVYRIGHCMIRARYSLSDELERRKGRLAIFDLIEEDGLNGARALPPTWTVQWSRFVADPAEPPPQFSKTFGPQVSRPLRHLPMRSADPRLDSLAFRTLLRGFHLSLPCGQDVARRMCVAPLDGNDPLWIYVLREAADGARGGGARLGPLAARLVAEVFVGLLAADAQSYYATDPGWTPRGGAGYGLRDFLADAGAPITRAQWDRRHQDY